MLKATMGKEIVVRRTNEIGVLADIAKIVAEKGLSILAMSAWVEGSMGVIHLVVDDTLRAMDALRLHKYDPKEMSVVMMDVPHKPGMLKLIAEKLKTAGIDLHHLYASAPINQPECGIVFSSSDNQRALVVLNQEQLAYV